jgi:hypothetical protein
MYYYTCSFTFLAQFLHATFLACYATFLAHYDILFTCNMISFLHAMMLLSRYDMLLACYFSLFSHVSKNARFGLYSEVSYFRSRDLDLSLSLSLSLIYTKWAKQKCENEWLHSMWNISFSHSLSLSLSLVYKKRAKRKHEYEWLHCVKHFAIE